MEIVRRRSDRARLVGAFIGGVILCGACGGASPTATPEPTSLPTATTTPTAAPTSAPTPTAPLPTFASTWELAAAAPPGAVALDLTFVHGQPRFQPSSIQASAGTVTFFLRNVRFLTVPHDFRLGPALLQRQAGSPLIQAGQSGTFTVENLPPGTYTFWCDVSGGGTAHYAQGMVGTLTVVP
jgi:plastocyanin